MLQEENTASEGAVTQLRLRTRPIGAAQRLGGFVTAAQGKGFELDVAKDQRVEAGDLLAKVDLDAVKAAGYDTTTMVVVINTATLKSVTPAAPGEVSLGDSVIDIEV